MRYNQTTEQSGAVQLFTHPSFGTIRTAGSADNPLLCLKDLCEILDLDSRVVVRRLTKGVHLISAPLPTSRGLQHANFVTEPGLYKVIFQSRKPEAETFTDWVTYKVLPSIRKTGHYGVDNSHSVQESITSLEMRITAIEERQNNLLLPPAVSSIPSCAWTLGEIARELDVDSYYLTCLLSSINVVKKSRHVVTCATQRAQSLFLNLPYGVAYIGGVERWDGIIVTEKGRKEILDCLPTYKKQHPYL